ncbi:hypothetical protein ACODM8_07620 [Vibrio ostreicida]|uniref:hypothetical protein n=1 Tax=Vibrio ostreicida TaxID=526588 RepID=UPI003B593FC2
MIDKEVITIEKELYNSDFEFYDSRALRVDWINKNNYQVFIFLGGTEVLFEPIFSNLNSFLMRFIYVKSLVLKKELIEGLLLILNLLTLLIIMNHLLILMGFFLKIILFSQKT